MALVEFGLMLLVMALLIFGVITFAMVAYDKPILTQASRQAVRAWVVTQPILTKDAVQQIPSVPCQNQLISFGGRTVACVPVATGPDAPVLGNVLTVSVSMAFSGLYVFKDMQINSQTRMKFA